MDAWLSNNYDPWIQFITERGGIAWGAVANDGPEVYEQENRGVGGSQSSGKPMSCSIRFGSLPGKAFPCAVRPISIKGESKFVLLGKDFMSRFKLTEFDWANNRVRLGDDWVYCMDTEYEQSGPTGNNVFKVNPIYKIGDSLSDEEKSRIRNVISEHKTVFAHNPKAPSQCNVSEHVIYTKDERIVKDKIRSLHRY